LRTLLSFAAVLSTAALLTAQSPLTTTFAGGNGQSGNMFDVGAILPVVVTGFDINLTGTADIEIYTLNFPNTSYLPSINTAGDWTLAGSAAGVVGAGAGVPTTVPITLAVPINPGEIQAFYVTTTNGTLAYTNGTAAGALFASNSDIEFFEGSGVAYPFTANFIPRVFNGNIYYSIGSGSAASNQAYGLACGGSAVGDGTFYEQYDAANPVDIANTSYTLNWSGNEYVVTPGASAFYLPTSANIGLGDDVVVTVAMPFPLPTPAGVLNNIFLGSNGYIGFQSGLPGDFTESVAELLSQQMRLAFFWDDLEPNASGSVTTELDGSGIFHITFTDVPEWGTTNLNTIQISLSPSGTIELKYGSIGSSTGIVGFSTGNGATDPGATDLTSALPLVVTTGVFVPNLTLAGATRPVTGTNWDLVTNGIDAVSPASITFFGDRLAAGVALPTIGINAPGCEANISNLFGNLAGVNVGGSSTVSIPVPNVPALVGAQLSAQSLGLSLSNPANIVVSNGVEGTVGDV
jgi:hypothetical protein